ncbi:hypothetical protein COU61_00630 [Candidatus Pacearchaeota archaeon CG10_big_fil_rev_8_21_14_0_10_35_13]|nr:MAG: hypothetical protein COU61_00630 [Candidatus Pacearchaeota archaeon CG10_big_fil_rev_8_21_14_0_10_35_13]
MSKVVVPEIDYVGLYQDIRSVLSEPVGVPDLGTAYSRSVTFEDRVAFPNKNRVIGSPGTDYFFVRHSVCRFERFEDSLCEGLTNRLSIASEEDYRNRDFFDRDVGAGALFGFESGQFSDHTVVRVEGRIPGELMGYSFSSPRTGRILTLARTLLQVDTDNPLKLRTLILESDGTVSSDTKRPIRR